MADYNRAEAGPQVHGRVGFDERDALMFYLLRHPGVFMEAKQVLTPEHFSEPYEIIWAIVWRSCMDLFDQFGSLPPKIVLEADALSRIADHPGEIPEDGVEELSKFLEYTFDIDDPAMLDGYQAYGFELLQKFLKERHWIDPVRRLIQEFGDSTPVDVSSLINDLQLRYAQVQAATSSPIQDLVSRDGDDDEEMIMTSTGFPFLDRPMGGGVSDGEVYGLLGGYGSGKTMLACGIAAEAATRAINEAVALSVDPRHVFYFGFETPPSDIRKRTISYLAQINLNHLDRKPYEQVLSRRGRRHPYEEELFTTDPMGEWERYNLTSAIWQTFHPCDMRGTRANPKAGSGGIEEIAAELEKYRVRYGVMPDTVIIDYALVCVRRYIKAKGWDVDRKLRHLVGEFGDDCRRLIATPFNCKVWVLNQLSGQANKRSAGARVSHADSAEATNFAENLWYAHCLGNKNRTNNTVTIECTKTRRSEGSGQPSILELKGHLARFVEADDKYMLDPNTNRIVKRTIGEMVSPEAARRSSAAAPRGRLGRSSSSEVHTSDNG